MISHERALALGVKLVEHFERKLSIEEECPECGCWPLTAAEATTLRQLLKDNQKYIFGDEAPAAPAKPNGPVAFPTSKEKRA